MNTPTHDKISKVYELANKGATDGEKEAAKRALDRLMKKYNLTEEYIKNMHLKFYNFSYSTNLDLALFNQLVEYFFRDKDYSGYKSTTGGKHIVFKLEYLDYIQLDCAYAYFRTHMGKQFKKHCHPILSKCRTNRTKTKRRAELQSEFFSKYVMASKLYHEDQLVERKLSQRDQKNRQLIGTVEGGQYNQQVTTGLYLEDGTANHL
jgi:hypothetical protein